MNVHDRDIFDGEDIPNSDSYIGISYGRPHIAKLLCARGYVSTYKEAFERYIGNECPAYIPKASPTTIQGIQMLKKAGAITSIAHPENTISEEYLDIFIVA